MEASRHRQEEQIALVTSFLLELECGNIIEVNQASLTDLVGVVESSGFTAGVEKDLVWAAVARAMEGNPPMTHWLLTSRSPVIKVC
jgi:hypothetical protein